MWKFNLYISWIYFYEVELITIKKILCDIMEWSFSDAFFGYKIKFII